MSMQLKDLISTLAMTPAHQYLIEDQYGRLICGVVLQEFISCVPVCSGGNDYLVNGACVDLSGGLDYDFKWEFSSDNEET
eukprot:CAMPEP_0168317280 /NCGR_PEP_ID=MMETSP0210-20121227/23582_1 /TAXON_ID=40633 /ORGANISM="Condylostoma magnum, Strain COL2" /LENGTH=79 /DNA_ID=CAMNT_0008313277 /DNA_START=843 /DNA_END=1082 /DNA_ORIENTATION=+